MEDIDRRGSVTHNAEELVFVVNRQNKFPVIANLVSRRRRNSGFADIHRSAGVIVQGENADFRAAMEDLASRSGNGSLRD
jgi:hypothetical protein